MAINVTTLPLLQSYQSGVPAPTQYNSRGPADTATPGDEEFFARHMAAYEEAKPFTDARGYVWRNRAAYDASLAELQRQQALARDPAYQQMRWAQNNLNMGNRGNPLGNQAPIGIPGTVVADPSGPMTPERRRALEETQRAAAGRGTSGAPGAPIPAPAPATASAPQPFTSVLSSFGAGRRNELPYWMRR